MGVLTNKPGPSKGFTEIKFQGGPVKTVQVTNGDGKPIPGKWDQNKQLWTPSDPADTVGVPVTVTMACVALGSGISSILELMNLPRPMVDGRPASIRSPGAIEALVPWKKAWVSGVGAAVMDQQPLCEAGRSPAVRAPQTAHISSPGNS